MRRVGRAQVDCPLPAHLFPPPGPRHPWPLTLPGAWLPAGPPACSQPVGTSGLATPMGHSCDDQAPASVEGGPEPLLGAPLLPLLSQVKVSWEVPIRGCSPTHPAHTP